MLNDTGRELALAVQQARGTLYRAPVSASMFHTSEKKEDNSNKVSLTCGRSKLFGM